MSKRKRKTIDKTLYAVLPGGKRVVRSTTTILDGGAIHVDRLILPPAVRHEVEITEREDHEIH